MLSEKWAPVRKAAPCPICGRPDWCQVSTDRTTAICRRVQSGHQTKTGGFIHPIHGVGATPIVAVRREVNGGSRHDFDLLSRQCRTALSPDRLQFLARQLKLSIASLERLDVGWHADKRVWTFPMRDPTTLKVVGIRTRTYDGKKFAIAGGTGGLFIPRGLTDGRLFIAEGPTDTAAVLDMGANVIGRESCSGGVQHIVTMLKGGRFTDVVIISQHDAAKFRDKRRPELGVFFPGQDGAEQLAARTRIYCPSVRVIMPPTGVKDAREWLAHGATAEDLHREAIKTPARSLTIKITATTTKTKSLVVAGRSQL